MTFKEFTWQGLDPSITTRAKADGTVRTVLTFNRETPRGNIENYTVAFTLEVEQLACLGSTARQAVWAAKQLIDKRIQAAYDRIITPGE